MPIHVLRRQKGYSDEWLQLNDDRSFTLTVSSPDTVKRGGPGAFDTIRLTEPEVRIRFSGHDNEIDGALAQYDRASSN